MSMAEIAQSRKLHPLIAKCMANRERLLVVLYGTFILTKTDICIA